MLLFRPRLKAQAKIGRTSYYWIIAEKGFPSPTFSGKQLSRLSSHWKRRFGQFFLHCDAYVSQRVSSLISCHHHQLPQPWRKQVPNKCDEVSCSTMQLTLDLDVRAFIVYMEWKGRVDPIWSPIIVSTASVQNQTEETDGATSTKKLDLSLTWPTNCEHIQVNSKSTNCSLFIFSSFVRICHHLLVS